jgi:hypothetical protein
MVTGREGRDLSNCRDLLALYLEISEQIDRVARTHGDGFLSLRDIDGELYHFARSGPR